MHLMNILFDPLNLVLATIVFFVGFKLYSVLGQRTGQEKMPPLQPIKTEPKPSDILATINPEPPKPIWQGYAEENSALAKGLSALAENDPSFDPKSFLVGAKIAHEKILEAFAKSDLTTLKTLLASKVYSAFETEVTRRKQQGETTIFKFVGINSAKIIAADLQNKIASIDVDFSSQMISAVKNQSGAVIQGHETALDDVKELWSFERDITARDPNWKLAETHDHE
jgi:predicted lipid-binding transport protein (Tim44 family)